MSDVFYLRPVEPPVSPNELASMLASAGGCFDLHRVKWKISFLAEGGGEILCWYQAPDAESARTALRSLGSDMRAVWPGNLLVEQRCQDAALERCNLFLSFSVKSQTDLETLWASFSKIAAHNEKLELLQGIQLVGTHTVICLLECTDPNSVLEELELTGISPSRLVPCSTVGPRIVW